MLDPASLMMTLEVASEAARSAQDVLLRWFRSPELTVSHHPGRSPSTQADAEAEEAIAAILQGRFPSIDFLGEEGGLRGPGSRLRWVVDPLDGGLSFVHGIPLWGTMIGLQDTEQDRVIGGVIHLPTLQETWVGGDGLGCFCNGSPMRIAEGPPPGSPELDQPDHVLDFVVVAAGDPVQFRAAGMGEDHARLAAASMFRGYTDCFGHALVLRGAVGVMVDPALSPWDVAATEGLIQQAGGGILTRPSLAEGKVDAILGRVDLVNHLADVLGW